MCQIAERKKAQRKIETIRCEQCGRATKKCGEKRCVMIHIWNSSILLSTRAEWASSSRMLCSHSLGVVEHLPLRSSRRTQRKRSSLVLDHLTVFVYSLSFLFDSIHAIPIDIHIGWGESWPWLLLPYFFRPFLLKYSALRVWAPATNTDTHTHIKHRKTVSVQLAI